MLSYALNHQPQFLDLNGMFPPTGDGIKTGGIDATVAENICQLCDVPILVIVSSCKQMPQIVREYLVRIDIGLSAQLFHLRPNITPIYGISVSSDEYGAAFQAVPLDIPLQLPAEFTW